MPNANAVEEDRDDLESEFWKRLLPAFEAAGLGIKQVEIARTLGVSQPSVSQWKVGRNLPDRDSMKKISELTNTCVEWLHSGEGPIRRGVDRAGATVGSNADICGMLSPSGRALVQEVAEHILRGEKVK